MSALELVVAGVQIIDGWHRGVVVVDGETFVECEHEHPTHVAALRCALAAADERRRAAS